MRKIIAAAVLAGIYAAPVHAEDGFRPEEKRPRPPGGGDFRPDGKDGRERPGFEPSPEMFMRLDADKDGKVTKPEFFVMPRLKELPDNKRDMIFARFDRNSDGVIDRPEIRMMLHDARRKEEGRIRELDQDKSGGLSFDEFSKGEFMAKLPEERRRQIFGRMDTDGDGEITAEDQPVHPNKPSGKPERRMPRPEHRPGGEPEGR